MQCQQRLPNFALGLTNNTSSAHFKSIVGVLFEPKHISMHGHNYMEHLISTALPLHHLASVFSFIRSHCAGHMGTTCSRWLVAGHGTLFILVLYSLVPGTCMQCICDTLTWLPANVPIPDTLASDYIIAGLHDIMQALCHPPKYSPLAPLTTNQVDALEQFMTILHGGQQAYT